MAPLTSLNDLIGIKHCKLGFYQDLQRKVEELKSSNAELENQRKENQAILDAITDLMIVLSEDLKIRSVNHVFNEWYPGVNPIGKHCYKILRNRDSQCEDCPVLVAIDRDEIAKDTCIYKVDDKYRHFELIASPLKTDARFKRHVLLFKRDVTLEKEFQAQFYQAEKMATVGTLAAGVAHEINNPLTAINGFAEGIKRRLKYIEDSLDEELYDDFCEYTDTIISECLRCRDIVRTLLTFSRPVCASFTRLNLNKCVNDTMIILKHHIKDSCKISVKVVLDEDLPEIMGDESHLKQVIINLLVNAFDATKDGGSILIRTYSDEHNWVGLIVEDNGCGIPIELQDKLFEPFFTTKPVGKGIGIGLSTCYSIVKSHGGEIGMHSEEGAGSSFCVRIPGADQDEE
ncbi:two-component system sensor histidine kinase NtrB [Maridesulfovibrio bastinii]|jgi:hypothetical protein|uniref:two-component system sensor histidine kinase NtrB n=1 Tax=Maridesulfovibrio bastinii TaxID=47157 RepID=UPI000406BF7B|nr:ATP-binding protein [Maridesulfovibrio bastinii]